MKIDVTKEKVLKVAKQLEYLRKKGKRPYLKSQDKKTYIIYRGEK